MNMEPISKRRSVFKKMLAGMAGVFGYGLAQASPERPAIALEKKVTGEIITDQEIPLFSSAVTFGNLVFIAGKGAHFEGDIKAHTKHVLDELEKELVKSGTSMEKVLKVNVYLYDLQDYKAMNEVFRGRFGKNPPVRTTIAAYAGIPGNSLVEMDCIAALK